MGGDKKKSKGGKHTPYPHQHFNKLPDSVWKQLDAEGRHAFHQWRRSGAVGRSQEDAAAPAPSRGGQGPERPWRTGANAGPVAAAGPP